MYKKNEIVLKPRYYASISGGKDSLYMFYLLLQNRNVYPLDGVIHLKLEIDYPFIADIMKHVKEICEANNIQYLELTPDEPWINAYNKWGFPNRKKRWCNKWKLSGLKKYDEFLRTQGMYVVSYIGYCVDEKPRYEKRGEKVNEIYPLVDMKIQEEFILQWAMNYPLYNDYYKFNRRCGCMYCPNASLINLAYLNYYYPEHYDMLMKYVKDTEEKYNTTIFQGNKKYNYNWEYIDNIVKFKYLNKIIMKSLLLPVDK